MVFPPSPTTVTAFIISSTWSPHSYIHFTSYHPSSSIQTHTRPLYHHSHHSTSKPSTSYFLPLASAINHTSQKQCTVALTREKGKNQALKQLLETNNIRTVEIPCIEHGPGPDLDQLSHHIKHSYDKYSYILITSPESAHVFLKEWKAGGSPRPLAPLAVVGAATAVALRNEGFEPAFVPTKSNGATLASELPIITQAPPSLVQVADISSSSSSPSSPSSSPSSSSEPIMTVLYPTSAKASDDIATALADRNIALVRINTYTTQAASWSDDLKHIAANEVDIVAFGSPSAVKAWKNNLLWQQPHNQQQHNDHDHHGPTAINHGIRDILAACIGETTAKACREHNVGKMVFCAENPGMDGWLKSVLEAQQWYSATNDLV